VTHHITPAPAAQPAPPRRGVSHFQPASVMGVPVVIDHPGNDPQPAVELRYEDGSWGWATDADLARAHAAAWTQAAERLDAMNGRKAAAA
jgi:hypothetical protein